MKFSETDKFSSEFKRLSKKYKSLPEDLEEFKKVVTTIPCGTSKHFTILHIHDTAKIIKARLACRYLKGSDKLRIVYAYHEDRQSVVFIEIYFKGEKEREDQQRLAQYVDELSIPKP